jgi:hypothetical protein
MVDSRANEEIRVNRFKKIVLGLAAALAAITVAAGIHSPHAQAYGWEYLEFTPSTTQAGGHPDLDIVTKMEGDFEHAPLGFTFHLPTGLIGNPHVAPTCNTLEFTLGNCSSDSQIGIVINRTIFPLFAPLYNLEPRPDVPGLLGFIVPLLSTPLFIELTSRTDGDYGLDAETTKLLNFPILDFTTRLWGVPADPSHDNTRFKTPLKLLGTCQISQIPTGCEYTHAKAAVPLRPFLQNPTTCGIPVTGSADTEFHGRIVLSAEGALPATTGCNQLSFDPSLAAKPTTTETDAPSGVDVDIKVPQTQSPTTPSPSEVRTTRVAFPKGFSLNSNAADGKFACLNAQTSIGTLLAATCSEFSKIGTLSLDIAALPEPIPGALYIGEPEPGNRYRVVLTADGYATHVKLMGSVHPDPETGQLTVTFEDLPQSTLQELKLHIFGSERGVFATPDHCGTMPVEAEFVPWDQNLTTRHTVTTMTFDSGPTGGECPNGPRPFAPRVKAGVANSTAGAHSAFSFSLTRGDGEQDLTGVTVSTPPGFAATLKGIPYCPESAIEKLEDSTYSGLAEQSSPACPAASEIGSAVAGAGAGTHPLFVPGRVYLAGPYKGAPLSLVSVVPAVSGPYDLGNVLVRTAIDVDPDNAQVTAVTDTLPQILEGVPLRTRKVELNLDRPNFALNPTNCGAMAIQSTIRGDEGAVSSTTNHFQVANCTQLNYGPRLSLNLSGGVKRRGHPAIRAAFSAGPGEANSRSVTVTLPRGELLDNAHLRSVCTRVDFAKDACGVDSQIGEGEVISPLLDQPLKGQIYLRSNPERKLPDIAVALKGQIDVTLTGRVSSVKGRLRVAFDSLPDAPISTAVLDFEGGAKGLLQNSESLCGARKRAVAQMEGQNGATRAAKPLLRTTCGAKPRHKRHRDSLFSRKAVR